MHRFTPFLLAAALGAAMMMSTGGPYELAAQHHQINSWPAAEVVKKAAAADVMSAAQERPSLPPGTAIVLRDRFPFYS